MDLSLCRDKFALHMQHELVHLVRRFNARIVIRRILSQCIHTHAAGSGNTWHGAPVCGRRRPLVRHESGREPSFQ